MFGISYPYGKQEVKEFLLKFLKPGMKICDMGAGSGTYQKLLGSDYDWTAVEIWPESVRHLKKTYNRVYEADIRAFPYPEDYDLVIFGDVLEHFLVEDAQYVLKQAELHSRAILIAVPFLYKQGAQYGNEAEKHLQDDLTPELFDTRYPGYKVIFKNNKYAYYWKES